MKDRCSYKKCYRKLCCDDRELEYREKESDGKKQKKTRITKFFSTKFNNFVYRLRYLFSAVFILLGIGAGIVASHIGPLTS